MLASIVNFLAKTFYHLMAASMPVAWTPEMARVQVLSPDHLRRAGLL